MQPGFFIVHLTRKAQVVAEALAGLGRVFVRGYAAKGITIPAPLYLARGFADHSRGVEVVCMDVAGFAAALVQAVVAVLGGLPELA